MNSLRTTPLVGALRRAAIVWVVLIGAVVGAALAALITATMPKSYTASTVLFIGSPAAGDSAGAYQGDLFSQQRAGTYAQLFSGDDLAVKVDDDLGLGLAPSALSSKVVATAVEKTVLLQVDVTDSEPGRAADIANAYARNFAQYVGQLENPAGGGQPSSLVSVITAAEPPMAPTSPDSVVNTAAGVFLGAVAAALAYGLRKRLDTRVSTRAGLSAAIDAPVLGELPSDSARRSSMLSLRDDADTEYAEQARKLRTTVQFADTTAEAPALLVAPLGGVDAGNEVSAHLALMLSETGSRVALVNADPRTSTLDEYVGVDPSRPGLTDVLAGSTDLEDVLVPVADGRVSYVPSGFAAENPGELLASPYMRDVVLRLQRTYGYVVVASSDAADFADSAVMTRIVDGVVVAVRSGKVAALRCASIATTLSSGGHVLGTVLVGGTDAPRRGSRSRLARSSGSPAPHGGASKGSSREHDSRTHDRAASTGDSLRPSALDARGEEISASRPAFQDRFQPDGDVRNDEGRDDLDAATDPFPVVSDPDGSDVFRDWVPAAPLRRRSVTGSDRDTWGPDGTRRGDAEADLPTDPTASTEYDGLDEEGEPSSNRGGSTVADDDAGGASDADGAEESSSQQADDDDVVATTVTVRGRPRRRTAKSPAGKSESYASTSPRPGRAT